MSLGTCSGNGSSSRRCRTVRTGCCVRGGRRGRSRRNGREPDRGFAVHSINPKQRRGGAGASRALRTDPHCLRWSGLVAVVASRRGPEAGTGKSDAGAGRYYPQFLDDRRGAVGTRLVAEPADAACRPTRSRGDAHQSVEAAIRRNAAPAGCATGAGRACHGAARRRTNRQSDQTRRELDRLVHQFAEAAPADDPNASTARRAPVQGPAGTQLEAGMVCGCRLGAQNHQACVLDVAGNVLGEREFEHGGAGLSCGRAARLGGHGQDPGRSGAHPERRGDPFQARAGTGAGTGASARAGAPRRQAAARAQADERPGTRPGSMKTVASGLAPRATPETAAPRLAAAGSPPRRSSTLPPSRKQPAPAHACASPD